MIYIVQPFFGATSMGATSGCRGDPQSRAKELWEQPRKRQRHLMRTPEARESEVWRTQDPG